MNRWEELEFIQEAIDEARQENQLTRHRIDRTKLGKASRLVGQILDEYVDELVASFRF